jgi:hypothetical protein
LYHASFYKNWTYGSNTNKKLKVWLKEKTQDFQEPKPKIRQTCFATFPTTSREQLRVETSILLLLIVYGVFPNPQHRSNGSLTIIRPSCSFQRPNSGRRYLQFEI